MRALIATILLILIGFHSTGQDLNRQIVQDAMRQRQDTGQLFYLRAELSFSGAQEVIKKGRLSGGDEATKMNKLVLTKADKDIVLQKLRSRRSAQWKDSLFENSKGLLRDTLQAILYDEKRGWQYFHKHIGRGYFQFSEPLVIRNKHFNIQKSQHLRSLPQACSVGQCFRKDTYPKGAVRQGAVCLWVCRPSLGGQKRGSPAPLACRCAGGRP